ncbi:MAG TPA: hypothetical protein VM285_11135 [Polyangia bacterium]|nr:hypothetical protein [Polyangia bacterium]
MARTGGFSAGLNPFGFGSLGNLGQYEIGATLASLELYQAEVAWGNGLLSDTEYLAALTKARDATTLGTRDRESSQNKLDDAVYRIGRAAAEAKGIDELIAFDQASLARMNPDNLRYNQIAESLSNELALRRRNDYGKLVDDHNAGKSATADLVAWVAQTLAGLTADDPDFEDWTGVASDLGERLKSEKDAEVYQDYQEDRIKGPAFLAYIASRRDEYGAESPKFDEWNRKLEDATRTVEDRAQSLADTTFFNAYQEGKHSDTEYLNYIQARINAMEPDDPSRGEWEHRSRQASFSIAEDVLRFAVEKGKKPVSELISFYKSYRTGLNPNSTEWRSITRQIDSLTRSGSSGGGGGGGGGGRSTTTGASKGTAAASVGTASPAYIGAIPYVGTGDPNKLIRPGDPLGGVRPLLTIVPGAPGYKVAQEVFDLNKARLIDAVNAGDKVWLFEDPRNPGNMTQARDAKGALVLGPDGKPFMIRGAGYMSADHASLSDMYALDAKNDFALGDWYASAGDWKNYYQQVTNATSALDSSRRAQNTYVQNNNQQVYDAMTAAIEHATKQTDWVSVINLTRDFQGRLADELANPALDDRRRDLLWSMGEKLGSNPLLPQDLRTDASGRVVSQNGGALNLAGSTRNADGSFKTVVLNQGWHFDLGTDKQTGGTDWRLVYDPERDPAKHMAIYTSYGSAKVKGEVEIETGKGFGSQVVLDNATLTISNGDANYFAYTNENGEYVQSWSLDQGRTWISARPGQPPPQLDLQSLNLVFKSAAQGGKAGWYDGAELVLAQDRPGDDRSTYTVSTDYLAANRDAINWYGLEAFENARSRALSGSSEKDDGRPTFYRQDATLAGYNVGGPGQGLTVSYLTPGAGGGWLNMTGDSRPYWTERYRSDERQILTILNEGGKLPTGTTTRYVGNALPPPPKATLSGSTLAQFDASAGIGKEVLPPIKTVVAGSSFALERDFTPVAPPPIKPTVYPTAPTGPTTRPRQVTTTAPKLTPIATPVPTTVKPYAPSGGGLVKS